MEGLRVEKFVYENRRLEFFQFFDAFDLNFGATFVRKYEIKNVV